MLDEIEKWVIEHYGDIHYAWVVTDLVEIHAASVPLLNGTAIGMGSTRQLAVHDLYESLCLKPAMKTELNGFWRKRRDALNRLHRKPIGRD